MDLALYTRVLWQWRTLVVAGVSAAFVLALLSVYKPSIRDGIPSFEHRTAEVWRSEALIYLTYPGFPGGKTTLSPDPLQFSRVAALYAKLANSDAVKRRVDAAGNFDGEYTAIPAADNTYGRADPLPMVTVLADAATPGQATALTRQAAAALISYVRNQQKAAGIPERQRVEIELLNAPSEPLNTKPRKKTLPIVVFLTVIFATIGLALVLENYKPRYRARRAGVEPVLEPGIERRGRIERAGEPEEPEIVPDEAPEEVFPEEPPEVAVRRWA